MARQPSGKNTPNFLRGAFLARFFGLPLPTPRAWAPETPFKKRLEMLFSLQFSLIFLFELHQQGQASRHVETPRR